MKKLTIAGLLIVISALVWVWYLTSPRTFEISANQELVTKARILQTPAAGETPLTDGRARGTTVMYWDSSGVTVENYEQLPDGTWRIKDSN